MSREPDRNKSPQVSSDSDAASSKDSGAIHGETDKEESWEPPPLVINHDRPEVNFTIKIDTKKLFIIYSQQMQ